MFTEAGAVKKAVTIELCILLQRNATQRNPTQLQLLMSMDSGTALQILLYVAVFCAGYLVLATRGSITKIFTRCTGKKCPPGVPGWPIIGNLLQLKEKKPYRTFTDWSKVYGPIYSVKTGALPLIVVSSFEIATEAMVTKFESISTRKLTYSLENLTSSKTMVAMSDYGDEHRGAKKMLLTHLLGPAAQKREQNRKLRETMLHNVMDKINTQCSSSSPVNLRELFLTELFTFALKLVIGRDVDVLYVNEMGKTLSKEEIFEILVLDPMKGAIEVDWRDFFPYLRWIPNKNLERKIQKMVDRRTAVIKALIEEEKKFLASGKKPNCYLDILLQEAPHLTENQLEMFIWEPIIESSDTTLVTLEWAMFELAKHPHYQDQLYQEVLRICGNEDAREDDIPKLMFLNAVFHETLRKHPPVPILPLRYVHRDVELGGFYVSAGHQIAINIYGCHRNESEWPDPNEWKPERFLQDPNMTGEFSDKYKIMAFGAGKRICAGTVQATLIACTSIARFIQKYKWQLAPGEEESVETISLTTHKQHPLKAMVTPRSG